MPKINYISNKSRAGADYDWLKTRYSFSFANYYDANRMGFGALRVINDDEIAPGKGFGTHPHRDMEIITIPLEGSLSHKDSMGSEGIITAGQVQVMSAGRGVEHSEYNASQADPVKLLQIWITPRAINLDKRYSQKSFDSNIWKGKFTPIVGPDDKDEKLMIQQDAWLSMADLDSGETITYAIKNSNNGVYFFIISGQGEIVGQNFASRDSVSVSEANEIIVEAKNKCRILAIDVPLEINYEI